MLTENWVKRITESEAKSVTIDDTLVCVGVVYLSQTLDIKLLFRLTVYNSQIVLYTI